MMCFHWEEQSVSSKECFSRTSPSSSTRRSLSTTAPSISSSFSSSSMNSRPSMSPSRYREPFGSTRLWHTMVLCWDVHNTKHTLQITHTLTQTLKAWNGWRSSNLDGRRCDRQVFVSVVIRDGLLSNDYSTSKGLWDWKIWTNNTSAAGLRSVNFIFYY